MILLAVPAFLASQKPAGKDENRPRADQGNGFYLNPVFPGNYGDPSIVRVGRDYYMAFSRSNGIGIFHSRDLVNWEPLVRHRLPEGYNTVWAVDLQYFDGKFHVYMPIRDYPGKGNRPFGNFVIRSSRPEGPWSDPIDLEIPVPGEPYSGIDPGFIMTPEGEKYLYVNHGYAMKLNAEGTKAASVPGVVYHGWQYPDDWIVECMCLESPKLFRKDGYYYMVSAQGGTSGPSTAHMSVVARSTHPLGPWENSPYNPLTRTWSHEEKFWHQGHGTVFEATDGSWWTVYHGRLNNYTEMGRPTLLMPVEWTEDGWPVVKSGMVPWGLLPMPEGDHVPGRLILSDDFTDDEPGFQWYFDNAEREKLDFGGGEVVLTASGKNHRAGTEIYQYAENPSFEVSVRVSGLKDGVQAGIRLGFDGIVTDGEKVYFAEGPPWRTSRSLYPLEQGGNVWLRIRNFRKDISFYWSEDGITWKKFDDALRSHDSYRISLVSFGQESAAFGEFRYMGLE